MLEEDLGQERAGLVVTLLLGQDAPDQLEGLLEVTLGPRLVGLLDHAQALPPRVLVGPLDEVIHRLADDDLGVLARLELLLELAGIDLAPAEIREEGGEDRLTEPAQEDGRAVGLLLVLDVDRDVEEGGHSRLGLAAEGRNDLVLEVLAPLEVEVEEPSPRDTLEARLEGRPGAGSGRACKPGA